MDSTGSGTSAAPCASVRPCRTTISGKSLGHRATKDTPQATGGRGPKTSRSLPGRPRAVTPRNAHGGCHPGWVPPQAHTEAPCDHSPCRGAQPVLTPRGCKAARRNNAKRQGTLADPVAAAARRLPRRGKVVFHEGMERDHGGPCDPHAQQTSSTTDPRRRSKRPRTARAHIPTILTPVELE